MWVDRPILGVGFGSTNFQSLLPQYLGVVHTTYLQILVDSGLIVFMIYIVLLGGTIFWLGRSASRMRKTHPHLEPYPMALQGAILAFAVGSVFLSPSTFTTYSSQRARLGICSKKTYSARTQC
jgi:O-antigen ligase